MWWPFTVLGHHPEKDMGSKDVKNAPHAQCVVQGLSVAVASEADWHVAYKGCNVTQKGQQKNTYQGMDTTQTLITLLVFLAKCKQKYSGSDQLLWRSSYWISPLLTTFAHLMEMS